MIHLLTALPCEAKPLVTHYRLSRLMDVDAFTVYQKDQLTLTVSGVGRSAMAAAVAFTFMLFGRNRNDIWLNFGVAGHRHLEVGRCVLVHRITDSDSRLSWYPPLLHCRQYDTKSLLTVGRPELEYTGDVLYDMEASAFYETAARFSTAELVQCLKIVSDNQKSDERKLQSDFVSALVRQAVPDIVDLIEHIRQLLKVNSSPDSDLFGKYVASWHFTTQQQIRLRVLLRRWSVLSPEALPDPRKLRRFTAAKQVIRWLESEIGGIPVQLSQAKR